MTAANDRHDSSTVTVPRETLERLAVVLDHAYEAAWHLCDRGRADWSVLGEPITEAIRIARQLRDDARDRARRLAA